MVEKLSLISDFITADHTVTIAATVPTGLEYTAREEIEEKIETLESGCGQGKVFFNTSVSCLSKLHTLRSVDRLFLVVKTFKNYHYDEDKEKAICHMKTLPESLPWNEVERFWRENLKYCKVAEFARRNKVCEINEDDSSAAQLAETTSNLTMENSKDCVLKFRASANRIGKKQSITSVDAETHFGGAVQDFTQWKVDLSHYNFEILINLGVDFIMVGVALTLRSLHRRNITHFGYTTLRASIAYNMLRMCNIKPGEIVVDPMCGTGAIPIEGSNEWTENFYVSGDNSKSALEKCQANINDMNNSHAKGAVDVLRWDVKKLPWRTGLIDVCITDLPFGKRVGSKMDNRTLYPSMLNELARVSKLKTSRACILTHDKKSILNAINLASVFWKLKRTSFINMGGLRAAVYLLKRTNNPS